MRLVTIVGARPQFVKLAPVSRAMASVRTAGDCGIEDIIVHTGQHYDIGMSSVFFSELGIPEPVANLAVGSGSHGEQTARMLMAIEDLLLKYAPQLVIVYGDTNSTLAGALAAAKQHIPIAHVEAGLRSFDREMPEEVNRIVADHVSDILFAPTATAMQNLGAENLAGRAEQVGDVMLDAVRFNTALSLEHSTILKTLDLESASFAVATLHRAGNTDSGRLQTLLDALNDVALRFLPVVFPVHPRTRARIRADLPSWRPGPNLQLVEPLGYLDMIRLVAGAKLVLTDSGGLQKEAFFLNVSCMTLREETEWPETVDGGGNVLVGADRTLILKTAEAMVSRHAGSEAKTDYPVEQYFGDGHAAEAIVSSIVNFVAARS